MHLHVRVLHVYECSNGLKVVMILVILHVYMYCEYLKL